MHGWLALVGLVLIPQQAFWDLDLYRYWMWLGLNEGQWPVLSGSWVYPAGAIVPMLAAAVGGAGGGSAYAAVWALMITVLDAVALAFLLHTRRPDRPQEPPTTLGAWWWLAFLVLLGPVAMGRLDAVIAPVVVVALSIALNHPRITSALLTAAAWVKVAPGALLIALFVAVRRPWRSVVVPAAIVSVVVVGTVAALGGLPHVASFLTEQEERGLQIESPGATPWLVAGPVLHVDHAVPEPADRHLGDQGTGHAGRRGRARGALLPRARRGGAAALVATRAARCARCGPAGSRARSCWSGARCC